MFPFASALLLQGSSAGGGGGVSDTQTVISGASGFAVDFDRRRGFDQVEVLGSISDGFSDIYSGAAVSAINWFENGGSPRYFLSIPGASNSGWTKLTIGSRELLRASATFSAGLWEWTTADNAAGQAFGGAGSSHPCVFT